MIFEYLTKAETLLELVDVPIISMRDKKGVQKND